MNQAGMQPNNEEEERRRLEEEQALIPTLQKDPVVGPQGQRIKHYDEGGGEVQRRGEGLISQSEDAVFGASPYNMRKYSAGHNDPDFQDMVYRKAIANQLQEKLDVLRGDLVEKEADIAAGQPKEYYQDWDPEELSRAYEAQLMREIWAMEPMRRPYPAQYEYEHYHGNGVRDPFTGRVK